MYETGKLGPLTRGHITHVCDGRTLDKPLSAENLPPRPRLVYFSKFLTIPQELATQMMQCSQPQLLSSNDMLWSPIADLCCSWLLNGAIDFIRLPNRIFHT